MSLNKKKRFASKPAYLAPFFDVSLESVVIVKTLILKLELRVKPMNSFWQKKNFFKKNVQYSSPFISKKSLFCEKKPNQKMFVFLEMFVLLKMCVENDNTEINEKWHFYC